MRKLLLTFNESFVLVKFPFTDLTQTKIRPAVVVAIPGGENYLLCQITTKKRKISKYELPLLRTKCEGDIRFDSNIYVDMIITLHHSLIQRTLGTVSDRKTKEQIKEKMQALFSF